MIEKGPQSVSFMERVFPLLRVSIIPFSGSVVSQLPSLNFLVLVAPPTHSPLLIRDPRGGLTDNFLVPQWGGVVIFSPPEEKEEEGGGGGGGVTVVRMEEVMSVFVKQLQLLLGVPKTSASLDVVLETGNLGMTEWV